MGITDLAYDFLQEILSFDPDRAQLRAKLGQTRFQGTWYDPFDLVRATQGITWDHRLGWVLSARKDAYDEGRYYELDQSQWTTSPKDGPFRLDPRAWTALKEANARHSRLATPWLIRTRHLEIRGTADLDRLVEMANRLEQFYDQIFAAYAAFFTRGKSDFKLILGLAEHPPLVVHCYRSKEDYAAAVGDDLAWTAGLFNPSRRASFFYGHPGSVMYHEFTHQILHVFTNGNRSPAWLTEGIAVYTDAPSFSGGKLILGDLRSNPRVLAHLELARAGKALPFAEIVDLRAYSTWQEKAKAGLPVYEAAGALVTFCMEADDRAHRADFVDFLRDNYEGHPDAQTHSLWEYLGTDRDRLSQSFQNWMRGVSGDRTRPQDGSRPQPR
jgi:hypothetical protein